MNSTLQEKIIRELKKKKLDSHDYLFAKQFIQDIHNERVLIILGNDIVSLKKSTSFLQEFLSLVQETKNQVETTLTKSEEKQMHNSTTCTNAKEIMLHSIICRAIKQFYSQSLNGDYNNLNVLTLGDIEDEKIKYAQTTGWNKYSREILFAIENIEDFFIYLIKNQVFNKINNENLWDNILLVSKIFMKIKREVLNTKNTNIELFLQEFQTDKILNENDHIIENLNINVMKYLTSAEISENNTWLESLLEIWIRSSLKSHWVTIKRYTDEDLWFIFESWKEVAYYTSAYVHEDHLYWFHFYKNFIEKISFSWELLWIVENYPQGAIKIYEKEQGFVKNYFIKWVQVNQLKDFLDIKWVSIEENNLFSSVSFHWKKNQWLNYTTLYLSESDLYWEKYNDGIIQKINLPWYNIETVNRYPTDAIKIYDNSTGWFTYEYESAQRPLAKIGL